MSKRFKWNESEQWVDLPRLAAVDKLRDLSRVEYIDTETCCSFISNRVGVVMTLIANEPRASAFGN